jgi:hypothetical protein
MKQNSVCASSFFCIPSVKALHCIGVLTKALKFAVFWSSRKLTSLRGTKVLQPSPLSPFFTHYLPCSCGHTALKYAIDSDKADVAAYLRSIGAPQ